LLYYLIDAIRIKRDVPPDLLYGRKRILIRRSCFEEGPVKLGMPLSKRKG
jgi:hypothetical protein